MKTICSSIFIVLLLAFPVHAWDSGASHHYVAYGLTGGGNALDGISGVSIGNADMCIVYSGATVQFYRAHINTGSTTEASPVWITPDDLQAGGTGSGTTMWRFLGVSGDTVWANALYVDATRWDDGSGGLDETLVRAGVTPTVFDKSTDELGNIISGTSDQFLAHNGTAWAVVDPASAREALGENAGTDITADLEEETHATEHESGGGDAVNHDNLDGFVANEHLDWTADQGATDIHDNNINQNAGTDITADLEEETHATEHESGGADEMQLSDMASGVSDLMDKTGDAAMIADWDTAYGWGDHGAVGYLTGTTNHAVLHAPGGDWTLDSYYLTGTTNHAALHAPGGDWDLSSYYLSGTTDHHALHEAGGDWELDIGNLASGTSRVFDKSTDTIVNIDGTAWRVFYSDGSGDLTELALGANGTYLKSQGAASAPAWDTPAGGGGGGSGATTIQTSDGTEAETSTIGDAPDGFFVVGAQGIETTASGNTVTVKADDVHSQVTAYIAAQDFLTEETDATALAALELHTDPNTTSGASIFDGTYDADILIWDSDSGEWSAQDVDGDATIDDTGAVSLAADSVADNELDDGADSGTTTFFLLDWKTGDSYTNFGAAGDNTIHALFAAIDDDWPSGGGGGGSGLTTFRTGEAGSEAESATIGDAPGGMFLMGNESGVSVTGSGSTLFYTVPKTIAYGWATNGAGMSNEAGVSTPPIRVRWDCLIERVTVSSLRAGANSGVSIDVFYNASSAPDSGDTIFNSGDTGKPGSSHAYSKDWISGGTQMATGGYIAFMPQNCGSGVTRVTITIDVRTLSDGN